MALFSCKNIDCKAETNSTFEVVLKGKELGDVINAIGCLICNLKNALIVFDNNGMLIHAGLDGDQVYVPVSSSSFSSFVWKGQPAVFLANVDGKKTMLDAFRINKKTPQTEVKFIFSGASPGRTVTQITTLLLNNERDVCNKYDDEEDSEKESKSRSTVYGEDVTNVTLMKRELVHYSTCVPKRTADTYLTLHGNQITKLHAIARPSPGGVVFELDASGRFSIASVHGNLSLVTDGLGSGSNSEYEEDYYDTPSSSPSPSQSSSIPSGNNHEEDARVASSPPASVFKSASSQLKTARMVNSVMKKCSAKKAENNIVKGCGSSDSFRIALEVGTGFRTMLQKMKGNASGVTLGFYTKTETPVLSVSACGALGATVFFFCSFDCPSTSEVLAWASLRENCDDKKSDKSSKKRKRDKEDSDEGGDEGCETKPHTKKQAKSENGQRESATLRRARQSIGKVLDLCSYFSKNALELGKLKDTEAKELGKLMTEMQSRSQALRDTLLETAVDS